jgi:hypothetical protein
MSYQRLLRITRVYVGLAAIGVFAGTIHLWSATSRRILLLLVSMGLLLKLLVLYESVRRKIVRTSGRLIDHATSPERFVANVYAMIVVSTVSSVSAFLILNWKR